VLAACAVSTLAQTDAPPSAHSASSVLQPNREPSAAQQARDQGTPPGGPRPERPTVPQVNVPLGRDPAASQPAPRASRPAPAASMTGVDDSVARCEAERDPHVRAACRARLAREGHPSRSDRAAQ
jgi:hypothetical protein